MSVRNLVDRFYGEFWNQVRLEVADEILHPEVTFRGSVGLGAKGPREVCDYVTMVTNALTGYRCHVLEVIVEDDRAVAKVRFSGVHEGTFLGYPPTGQMVEWIGAAFFASEQGLLKDIWVLGDLISLRSQLAADS
jgi:predicted ester cyclase